MPRLAANALVFFASAAILVLEILAARVLAPYVGLTLETYTGIIGTVLAGIALGAWWGGRLADRMDPRLLLGPMLLLGGVLALATVPAVSALGGMMRGGGPLAIVALALVGFFAPAAVLAAVTPTVVKLQLASLAETGSVVGRLSAIGTVGALFGTFATGFLLVAAFPTRPTILVLGGLLVAVGVLLSSTLPRQRSRAPVGMLALAALGAAATLAFGGPCEHESPYFCARVEVDPARASGRVLVLDTVRHSYVDLEDPTHLEFRYTRAFADVLDAVAAAGEPLDVVHVGGGGFTMPRYLAATRPGSRNVVLELDPMLVRLAERDLGLEPDELDILVGDARLTLASLPPQAFDVVIGDAFGGLWVPWHLTTREFTEEIRARLRPGGIYVMNVIDHPPLGFARAEAATMGAVFPHVAILVPSAGPPGSVGGNFVVIGSDQPLPLVDLVGLVARRGETLLLAEADLDRFVGDARVLVDDHAPVDQLLTPRP